MRGLCDWLHYMAVIVRGYPRRRESEGKLRGLDFRRGDPIRGQPLHGPAATSAGLHYRVFWRIMEAVYYELSCGL